MKSQMPVSGSVWSVSTSTFISMGCLLLALVASAEEPEPLHEGIPVPWWETYFGPDYATDPHATALADPDGDEANNFLEYATHTHPLDGDSFERQPVSVSTYAGSEQGWQDGPLTEALLNNPRDLAYDPQGRLWFTETTDNTQPPTSNRIRIIDEQEQITTLTGDALPGLVNGTLAEARFNTPQTPVFDSHGNAYIADTYNHCVRKISVDGVVSTLAGSTPGYRNGTGLEAQFHTVQSVCIDASDNLYVADWDNICIRKITPDGAVTLYAGRPGIRGTLDGPRLDATFETPDQMAFAPNGNMYLTDWVNGTIRVIDTNGMVGTFAGGMTYAHRILIDSDSNIYATWGVPGPVTFLRKFRPDTTIAWTVGGHDQVGLEDGPIASAKFAFAFSPVLRPDGDILISDQLNHRIRRLAMGVARLLTIHGPPTFYRSASIRIEAITTQADVRYTLDGSEPNGASPLYTGPISINATSTTLRARLFVQDVPVSELVSATFTRLDTPGAPTILNQPYSHSVEVGGTARFQVYAIEEPLTYQWIFEGAPLEGEVGSVLLLQNVQPEQAGDYAVIVSNPVGSVTSETATLTVTQPPTLLRLSSTVVTAGETFPLGVELEARGTENALGFSIATVPDVLTFLEMALAVEAPPGASLFVNSNSLTAGRVGILVSMPPGETFPAGRYPLLIVQCRAASVPVLTWLGVWFASEPILLQVSDVEARPLPVYGFNGDIQILPAPLLPLEGDVAPRFNGDRLCTVIDWVQTGRFVAALDVVAPDEFERVDCAPRPSLGNGMISVADWVQAGRYAAGLDPPTPAGGPVKATTLTFSQGESPRSFNEPVRTLTIPDIDLGRVSSFTVPVQLQAVGGENAVGFSVAFDPARFQLTRIEPGSGAAGAALNSNFASSASGRAGVALAWGAGGSFPPGNHEIARLHFKLLDANAGESTIAFMSHPVQAELADVQALTVACDFSGGTIGYAGAAEQPRLGISRSGSDLVLYWPSNHADFSLQESTSATGEWTPVKGEAIPIGVQMIVIISAREPMRYFRLHKP